MSFVSMCDGTSADWEIIKAAVDERQLAMPRRVLDLLRQLEAQTDGFAVNQLEHSLQTATRALRGGADDELVVAALCHDIGKAISVTNHASIGAAILRPYVGPDTHSILLHHQEFQGLYYFEFLGRDPRARDKYVHEP
jgi:predicted HD phosphohydrolase